MIHQLGKIRRIALALGLLASLMLASSALAQSAFPLVIEHQLGTTRLENRPEKVVVFDFGALDTLDKLGVDVIALPKTLLPGYLSKFNDAKYVNVGSLQEPDFEQIYALKPDLIIVSSRQSSLYDEFRAIAPTVYVGVDTTQYMESFEANVRTLGRIFGKEAEAEAELAKVREAVASVRAKAAASRDKALVVLVNDGRVSAYGPKSRYGLIHDELGFAPVDPGIVSSTHGQSISFEYILDRDPDILFVVDRTAALGGESGAKAIMENQLVRLTKAYENGKIIYLEPDVWYLSGGGLVSVARMVEQVAAALD